MSVPSLPWWSVGMRDNEAGRTVQPSEAGASTSDHSMAATHASDLTDKLHALKQLLPTSAPQQADRPNSTLASFVLKDGRATLNKTRLFGRSHWDTTVQEFEALLTVFNVSVGKTQRNADAQISIAEIRNLSEKCKALARQLKLERPGRYPTCSLFDLSFPARNVARELAHLYVTRFESAYRILHIPSFWAEFERHWLDSTTSTVPAIRLQLLLVMAIGSTIYNGEEGKSEDLRSLASASVYLAQNWLSGPMDKDRLTLAGLQVQCLLILARQCLSIGDELTWISVGTVLRTAMQMGLHRDPRHFPNMGVLQAEIRRRLWATILELNLQSSLEAGMPSMLAFSDFDTCPPADVNDKDIDENTNLLPQHENKTGVTDTHVQIVLWSCIESRLQVIQCLNGISGDLPYQEVLAITSDIENACKKCAQIMQQPGQDQASVPGACFRGNYADHLLRRFLLPLHRPFSQRCRTSPLLYFSRKVSIDTALAVILPFQDKDFDRLIEVTRGPVRDCVHQASLVLSLELVAEVEETLETAHLASVSSHREMMMGALNKAIGIEARRLQNGETNVKLHMWLSMIVGHLQATMKGEPVHESLLRSAKESLESSYRFLLQRYSPSISPSAWQHVTDVNGQLDAISTPQPWSPDFVGGDLFDLFDTSNYIFDSTTIV